MDLADQRRTAAAAAHEARTRTHATLIDGRVVRNLRLRRGLGQSMLAAAMGVTDQVIFRLETGSRQNTLSVNEIVDLAHALGVTPRELLARPERPLPGDVVEDTDIATVGSLLTDADRWVDIDDLASTLEWTLARTLVALDNLEVGLALCGQRLAWTNDRDVRLCAAPNDAGHLRDVTFRDIQRNGLNVDEARLVHLLARGRFTEASRNKSENFRNTMTRLVNAGLIPADVPFRDHNRKDNRTDDDKLRLSDLTRRNLRLDRPGRVTEPRSVQQKSRLAKVKK